ncbi:HAD hydrolase family protein [Gordoniibacillus kamchatkensis]|uniref:HAD hydrolase family protein n=1 Tax=Gordoniibacillus kamchatkensis TaxID=1590651 RepID=UPI0006968A80|nr:HAD family hydrolase [Paenibacillus sp. VKM B-2647]
MVKLVAFDVDGTLRDKEFMPDSTRGAIAELQRRGIAVALCTGRSEYEMAPLCKELGIDWAVTCNGAHIGHRGATVLGTPFAREQVRSWLRTAEERGDTLLLYGAELMLTNRLDDPYFRRAQREIGFREPVLLQPGEEAPDIYQCIAFIGSEDEEAYVGDKKDRYYLHRWRDWAIDINPEGTNKAAGLRKLLTHLDLKAAEAAPSATVSTIWKC